MKQTYQLCYFMIAWNMVLALIKPAEIQLLRPRGLKFNITDGGYELVGVHYSINTPVYGVEPGKFNYDITEQNGGFWVHINGAVDVTYDDTVYYWLYVIYKSKRTSESLLNQSFQIKATKATREIPTTTEAITVQPKRTGQQQQDRGVTGVITKTFNGKSKDFPKDTATTSVTTNRTGSYTNAQTNQETGYFPKDTATTSVTTNRTGSYTNAQTNQETGYFPKDTATTSVTTNRTGSYTNAQTNQETGLNQYVFIALCVLMIPLAFSIAFIIYRTKGRCKNKSPKGRCRNNSPTSETREATMPKIAETTSVNYVTPTNVLTEDNVYHHLEDYTCNSDAIKDLTPDYTYDLPEQRRASGQYDELQFPNNTYLELQG